MWLVTIWMACGEAPPAEAPPAEAPPAEAPPAEGSAPANPHAAHQNGSDHMAQMTAMRDALRAELGEAYDAPVPGLGAANAEAGARLYEIHCASCHGASGKGDGPAAAGLNPPPSDLTDPFHSRFYSDAGRIRVIQNGSPGTAMVGFAGALDPQQILEIYAHVRALRPTG